MILEPILALQEHPSSAALCLLIEVNRPLLLRLGNAC
jgi:hypothetical protein